MQFWDDWKAARKAEAQEALLKAVPWGIGLFVVLALLVKLFSAGTVIGTVRFLWAHLFIIAVLALLVVGAMAAVIAGGAVKDAFEDKSTARDKIAGPKDKTFVVVKTRSESLPPAKPVKAKPEGLLTSSEPPPVLEGFAALKYLFGRDKPEAR
jgi:membrane protein required for beta-lactamase induction